jgi:uncharacterized Zn finger protein
MSKYNRPSSTVECKICGVFFSKENRLIKKTIDRNGVHCCSRDCGKEYVVKKAIEKSNPFNHYLINIRKRKFSFNETQPIISAEYLETIWNKQKGLCAITNIEMHHAKQRTSKELDQASVDRIDNNRGYIEGNVQFTTLGANYLRNTFDLDDVLKFIAKL